MALNELKLIIGKNLYTSIEFHDEIKPTKKGLEKFVTKFGILKKEVRM
jgi:hypothetical protein